MHLEVLLDNEWLNVKYKGKRVEQRETTVFNIAHSVELSQFNIDTSDLGVRTVFFEPVIDFGFIPNREFEAFCDQQK